MKDVSQPRACPFVLPIASNDAFIFGNMDYHADAFDTIIVDRLRGEPLRVPLFDEWKPLRILAETRADDCHIGIGICRESQNRHHDHCHKGRDHVDFLLDRLRHGVNDGG